MLKVLSRTNTSFVKLADIADLNPRLREKPALDTKVSFVPMAAVSSETGAIVREEIRPYGDVAKGFTVFECGDVLVAKITPCFENNKIAQANLSLPIGFGSTEFHVVRARRGESDSRYLFHCLRQDHVRSDGERKMTGSAGQRRVPEHFLADLDIFLPPLPEQKRIAAILDQADALRAKRRDALAKLDEMAQAIFAEMFGNVSQAFQKWKTIVVRDTLIIPLRNGVSPASEGKVPGEVLTLSAVTGRLFNTKARKQAVFSVEVPVEKRVSASDLLICRGNGNANLVGRGFFPVSDMPDVAFPDTVIAARFNPQLFEPLFIQAIWNGKSVRNQIERHARTTNGTFKVNQTAIESIELIAPPIPLQRAFSNRMRSIQSAQLNLEQHSEKLDSLFLSLQHRAFSGDL